MQTATFKYREGVTTYSRTFEMESHRGLEDPDCYEIYWSMNEVASDGRIVEEIEGFRRIVECKVGTLQEDADRAFMLEFVRHPVRWVQFGAYVSSLFVLADPQGFANNWEEGSEHRRRYEIRLREAFLRTEWPTAIPPVEVETLFIKSDVEITGTEDAPQTLTTNAGALATMDTGEAFPAFPLADYVVTVLVTEGQGCLVSQPDEPVQVGDDISFSVYHANTGNPAPDGKFYARITIGIQARP